MGAPNAIDLPGEAIDSEVLARLTDLATPFAVRVAATLRVPDLIDSGVTELGALAAAAGADRDALGRLLRYLVHRGVFTEPVAGEFGLTSVGRLLSDGHGAAGQRRWLDVTGLGMRMDLAYTGLLHSVRTGEEAYTAVHGRSFWADLDADPVRRGYFDELMASQHVHTAPQVVALYDDWSAVGHVVDVGGGSGALLAALLRANPRLRGTLVDRPGPARMTAERFDPGLVGRAEFVEGDFFGPLPTQGDVYVVSRAITDWNDRDAAVVLRRCAEAAGPVGRVLVVEVLPTEPHVPHAAPFDLQMLAVVGGRERTLDDFAALIELAGLAITRTLHGRDGLVLIECAARADE